MTSATGWARGVVGTAVVLAVAVGVARTRAAGPEDWSRFRGPNGSGVSETAGLPLTFGPEENVIWKTELPFGHSSPILTGDRIYLTAVREGRLVTICLDRPSGRILWERPAPRPRTEKLDTRNGPAGPSPAVDGRDVYVFFADFGLISYDKEGKERWRVPLGPFNNIYGMGASPVLVGDLVILVCDQSTNSYIVALDKKTGAVRWKTPRPEARSGHSTPIVYQAKNGGLQILAPGSFQLTSYDAMTGAKLWWVRGLSFELKSTPVVSGDVLFINGFGAPENQPGAQRFRGADRGDPRRRTRRDRKLIYRGIPDVICRQYGALADRGPLRRRDRKPSNTNEITDPVTGRERSI